MKISAYISIVFTCIFLLTGAHVYAQKKYVPEIELTTKSNTLNHKLAGKQYYNMIVPDGTVFLFNDWRNGYVKLVNGDRYDNLSLKYNIFHDQVIHINERSVSMIMLDKSTISEFGFYREGKNDSMTFTRIYSPKNPDGEYFFERPYNNKLQLLIRHRSLEEETTPYKDAYGIMRNSKYNTYKIYYLVFPGNRFEKFRPKRRSFAELFSGSKTDKKEVRKILRRNHIYFESDAETARAVQLVEEALFSK